jgi:hypothetical protein
MVGFARKIFLQIEKKCAALARKARIFDEA